MPKRTNLHQAVIYYAKRHVAPPEVEVTESKMLLDRDSGQEHEVDIVMEGRLGDERVVISIEVTASARPAGTPWVNTMLGKHARMPTGKLVLVSWSGFTGPALTKIEQQGGDVLGLRPEIVPHATVPPLFYEEINTTPEKAALLVRNNDRTLTKVNDVPILLNIYAAPDHDARVFTLRDLVLRHLNDRSSGEELSRLTHEHEDRESLTHFSIERIDLDDANLYVHDGEKFLLLFGFDVWGPILLRRQPVEFTVMRLGDTLFAMTEIVMAGKDAVWVLTPKDDNTATVLWRLI